jgi:hypothetical protein
MCFKSKEGTDRERSTLVTSESESTSQYGPVSFVATAQAQSSFAFKDGINIRTNRLDEFSQTAERPGQVVGLAPLLKERRQIFLGVSEGYVLCEKTDALGGVGVNEFPDTPPQYGTNEDIRIENDHLSGQCPSRDDAVP